MGVVALPREFAPPSQAKGDAVLRCRLSARTRVPTVMQQKPVPCRLRLWQRSLNDDGEPPIARTTAPAPVSRFVVVIVSSGFKCEVT